MKPNMWSAHSFDKLPYFFFFFFLQIDKNLQD